MAKISKIKTKQHLKAMDLAYSDKSLSIDDREFILEHYNPMACHLVGKAGIFFTPRSIAKKMQIEIIDIEGKRLLDLCAGIGGLSYDAWKNHACYVRNDNFEIVCIENNPEFIDVGKRVLPEATWIQADAFDKQTYENLGYFHQVISNPPYGISLPENKWLQPGLSQFKAVEAAMKVSNDAVFILLQGDCPFEYSGRQMYKRKENKKYEKFHEKTGIVFEMNCGIDLSFCNADWNGLSPGMQFEIVCISKEETE